MDLVINTYGTSVSRDNEGFIIRNNDGNHRIPVNTVYYNPNSEHVNISDYLYSYDYNYLTNNQNNNYSTIDEEDKYTNRENKQEEPDNETITKIKEILQLKKIIHKANNPVYTPEILNSIESELRDFIQELGFSIKEIVNIQYGKKIKVQIGLKQAEVNLFYGKKGFSVVKSPNSGNDPELISILFDTINTFINNNK